MRSPVPQVRTAVHAVLAVRDRIRSAPDLLGGRSGAWNEGQVLQLHWNSVLCCDLGCFEIDYAPEHNTSPPEIATNIGAHMDNNSFTNLIMVASTSGCVW